MPDVTAASEPIPIRSRRPLIAHNRCTCTLQQDEEEAADSDHPGAIFRGFGLWCPDPDFLLDHDSPPTRDNLIRFADAEMISVSLACGEL
jgi:hypothetical protein